MCGAAARLCGAAEAHTAARGGYIAVDVRDSYEETIAAARANLEAATFAAAWAEGQAMTRDEAITYALAWTWPDDAAGVGDELSPRPVVDSITTDDG